MNRTPIRRKPKRQASPNAIDYSGFRFSKSRPVRVSGAAIERLREQVYRRDRGRCQWKDCGALLPLYGSVFTRGHAAHIKSRGAGGGDELSNLRLLCPAHHLGAQHTKGLKDGSRGSKV